VCFAKKCEDKPTYPSMEKMYEIFSRLLEQQQLKSTIVKYAFESSGPSNLLARLLMLDSKFPWL
jgi:hypothetical protein